MMAKGKIVIFTTSYLPFVGGAEIAVKEVAWRLKGRFDFYIVTARFKKDLLKKEIRTEGTVLRLGFGTRFDKWLLPFFVLCPRLTLGQMFQTKSKPDFILGVDISQGSIAAAVYKFFHPKIPFILNVQYGDGDERLASGRLGAIELAFKFILKRADFVTAISSYLLDTVRKYGYEGPAEIIPNGVDIEKFKVESEKLKVERKKKIIITTSRLVPKNAVDTLIKAVAEVKKKIPNIELQIIGDGPERESLKSQVRGLGLEENIKFLGSVPYDDIPKYLHEVDIFVRPSRSEGMGNSFVEALAAGIPIIGTPVGGITDIIKDGKTGLFAKVDDPKDLAEKIELLLRDANLSKFIVEEGKKIVEDKFSWDKIADSYYNLFESYIQHSVFKILIATPIFPPQIGGPAIYAKNLGEEFKKMGHLVSIASFGQYLRYPTVIRHLLYTFLLIRRVRRSDVIFSLDYFSVGFPAAIVSRVFRIPLVLRMEGDFLWEGYVERTRRDVTLREFYRHTPELSLKEKIIWAASWFVIKSAQRISFSSEWRRNMMVNKFNILFKKIAIIKNVFPDPRELRAASYHQPAKKVVLWAGRMLYLKNLYRLIRAFMRINSGGYELHLIGEGTEKGRLEKFIKEEKIKEVKIFSSLPRDKLLERIFQAAFLVLPSLSDVGPNVIADSIGARTPFLMTKESGFFENFEDVGVFFNPINEKDLEESIKILMDEKNRQDYKEGLEKVSLSRDWKEAAKEWLSLFQSVNRSS